MFPWTFWTGTNVPEGDFRWQEQKECQTSQVYGPPPVLTTLAHPAQADCLLPRIHSSESFNTTEVYIAQAAFSGQNNKIRSNNILVFKTHPIEM